MSCYVSSNDNRFYAVAESSYGAASAPQANNRFPAVKLGIQQRAMRGVRKDKMGGRTFVGNPWALRKQTSVNVSTYLTGWDGSANEPGYSPLFRASLGGAPIRWGGGTLASATSSTSLVFSGAHELEPGRAVSVNGEIRFVTTVPSSTTVEINAPFSGLLGAGTEIAATLNFGLANDLQSASIFDYWSPTTIVQRAVLGAVMEQLRIQVNGDFHSFEFKGQAKELIDSASFQAGQGGLQTYPEEPQLGGFDYSIVPGHIGQVWIGSPARRFYTLTEADIVIKNNIDSRDREFGLDGPACVSAGVREITVDFTVYEQDNVATRELYEAAKSRAPIPVMLQLGNQSGAMFGVYMNAVVPEMPEFDDREQRLQWRFSGCRAQGVYNDELFVAFG